MLSLMHLVVLANESRPTRSIPAPSALGQSSALAVAAVEAGLAAVEQDERLRVALAAHRGARREVAWRFGCAFGIRPLTPALSPLGRGGGADHRPAHFTRGAYFRVFF